MYSKEIATYLKEISRFKFLDRETERLYLERAKNGNAQARKHLVCAHLALVVSIAKGYTKSLPLTDLIQEGNIALLEAIDKFDLRCKNRFGTYASYCIRQNILRAIYNQSRIIRLPVHIYEKYLKIKNFSKHYYNLHQKYPEKDLIAIETDLPFDTVDKIESYFERIIPLEPYHQDVFKKTDSPELLALSNCQKESLKKAIHKSLSHLPEREQQVIRSYFGLDSGQAKTLEEISKLFSLTKERIRQIKKETLRKLAKSKVLKAYADQE